MVPPKQAEGSGLTDVKAVAITSGAGRAYRVDGDRRRMRIWVPTSGADRRLLLVPAVSEPATDSESCMELTGRVGESIQPGLAFRVRSTAGGRVQALTVTQNVWLGFLSFFNVHVWDTERSPRGRQVARLDFGHVILRDFALVPYPWHLCGRVRGQTLEMQAWTGTGPRPPWGRTTHTQTAELPARAVASGATGWYIGHVKRGSSVTFEDLEARSLD
jgi:hypothetical protein